MKAHRYFYQHEGSGKLIEVLSDKWEVYIDISLPGGASQYIFIPASERSKLAAAINSPNPPFSNDDVERLARHLYTSWGWQWMGPAFHIPEDQVWAKLREHATNYLNATFNTEDNQ